jgi:hypothetical protein
MRTTRTNVIPLLPADYRETVMLQHARDTLAAARDVFIDGDPFNIDAMHAQVRHMLKMLADDHERNMARVVELALAGAEDAHEALLDLKAERHARGEPLGPGLETYDHIISERGPWRFRRPPVRPRENFLVAFVIVCLLIDLMQQFPELPLRHSSQRRPCACNIISMILIQTGLGRGDEDAIYKIWKRYGPPVNSGYRWNRKTAKKLRRT